MDSLFLQKVLLNPIRVHQNIIHCKLEQMDCTKRLRKRILLLQIMTR